jgi:hypothetical protein
LLAGLLLRVSIAKAGEDASRWPEFTKPELTIGRRSTNDIILPSDGVSGTHARLLVTGRTLTLVDLGSTNGTFVAGERVVGPRPVGPREEVLIGDFRLTFALVDPAVVDESPGWQGRGDPPRLPLSAAFGWSDDPALPPPPPLLDDGPVMTVTPSASEDRIPGPAPTPPSSTMISPTTLAAAAARGSVAVEGPSPPRRVTSDDAEEILSLDPHGAEPPLEQAFAAVWERVAADVIGSVVGVDRRIKKLLDQALAAVGRLGGVPADARARLMGEMLGPTAMQALLVGEPDEVLVLGTQGVRFARGGHVSTGPSPFSCPSAVIALGSRLCGILVDAERPMANRAHGEYAVQVIHGSLGGGVPALSLRRIASRVPSTLEELEAAGAVAGPHAEILRAAVRGGMRLVVCMAPGASARPVVGALLAAASSSELQVVVGPVGADGRGLRAGTVVLARERRMEELMPAALRLHPNRLVLEELPWSDGAALDVLGSPSLRVMVSLRAASAPVALHVLVSMLDARGHGHAAARGMLASGLDLFVSVTPDREGAPRITAISELVVHPNGELETRLLSAFDPERSTWSPFPVVLGRLDDLVHRGLLDPRLLEPRESSETFA